MAVDWGFKIHVKQYLQGNWVEVCNFIITKEQAIDFLNMNVTPNVGNNITETEICDNITSVITVVSTNREPIMIKFKNTSAVFFPEHGPLLINTYKKILKSV